MHSHPGRPQHTCRRPITRSPHRFTHPNTQSQHNVLSSVFYFHFDFTATSRRTQTATAGHTSLSLRDLAVDAERLQHESRAANTHAAYAMGVTNWNAFLSEYESLRGSHVTEHSILLWISWMSRQSLSSR